MPGGDGSDRSGGQWLAETQPNGTGRTDRTGEGRSGRCGGYGGGSDGSDDGSDGSDDGSDGSDGSDQHSCAPSLPPSLLLPFLDASFLFWMPPILLLALLPNRTLCLRRTRRYPRRRLAHLRLRPTCVPHASSSLALDASFALGRPCASFLIWMPCASILFWRPQSMFGCPRPCCAPFPSSSPFGRDSPLNWMPSALDLLTLLRLLPYLDASLPSRSLTMPRTCMRNFSHVLHFAHRVTFHIG